MSDRSIARGGLRERQAVCGRQPAVAVLALDELEAETGLPRRRDALQIADRLQPVPLGVRRRTRMAKVLSKPSGGSTVTPASA